MKAFQMLVAALAIGTASGAVAEDRIGTGQRITPPSNNNLFSWERGHGFRRGFGGVWIIERPVPVVIEREVVVKEVPAAAPASPPEPRKPYVLGKSYASLPGGCMKLIEGGTAYFYCSGEWYKQSGGKYVAVARKL